MGTMACNRNGCDTVLCHRYSQEYGYICSGCFRDLIQTGAMTNIKDFMNTEKINDNPKEAEARYNVVFEEKEYFN